MPKNGRAARYIYKERIDKKKAPRISRNLWSDKGEGGAYSAPGGLHSVIHSTTSTQVAATVAHQISVKSEEKPSFRAPWIHQGANYHQTDNALRRVAGRKIGAIGYAIFDVICSYADFYGGEACPPVETIAEELRITPPTVTKFIALMVRCKMLKKRTTCWGNAEQGPKSRNFYKPLPSNLWDFSSVSDKVKAVRKEKKADSNEVSPTNNLHRDVNHESQELSSKVQEPKQKVLVSSINEEIGEGTLIERLLATGLAPAYAEEVAAEIPSICEAALADLKKSKTKKGNVAGWMRNTIAAMRHRHGVTPEGYAPSEADLAIQGEGKPKKEEEVAPVIVQAVAESEQGREERTAAACDAVFESLEERVQDRIIEQVRDSVSPAARHYGASPAARKERLKKQREIVARDHGVAVQSVMKSRQEGSCV